MRWNCPHCGIALAISDEKLGAGWSFSRCYKCAGFALVRRSDVNLIKVDQAPAGDEVIHPGAGDETAAAPGTPALMSQTATRHLARVGSAAASAAPSAAAQASAAVKPTIRPAVRRQNVVAAAKRIMPALQSAAAQMTGAAMATAAGNVKATAHATTAATPAPATMPPRFVPRVESRGSSISAAIGTPSYSGALPAPLPNDPVRPLHYRILPAAIAVAGVMAVGSGIYLYIQGQALWQKARAGAVNEAREAVNLQPAESSPLMAQGSVPPAADSPQPEVKSDVVDQVHHNSMAPARDVADPATVTPLVIEVRGKTAALRAGPGVEFPLLGTAKQSFRYIVSDWKDRWFKVVIRDEAAAGAAAGAPLKAAWIRNDLVRLITGGEGAAETRTQ